MPATGSTGSLRRADSQRPASLVRLVQLIVDSALPAAREARKIAGLSDETDELLAVTSSPEPVPVQMWEE